MTLIKKIEALHLKMSQAMAGAPSWANMGINFRLHDIPLDEFITFCKERGEVYHYDTENQCLFASIYLSGMNGFVGLFSVKVKQPANQYEPA